MMDIETVSYFSFARLLVLMVPVCLAGLAVLFFYLLVRNRRSSSSAYLKTAGFDENQRNAVYRKKRQRHQEETNRILGMVEAGTITPDEADKLLNTLDRETAFMACPFCSQDIRIEAVKCRHCNQFLLQEMREAKRLTKSQDCIICGVCGGIAHYANLDPVIIRVLAIIVILLSGIFTGIFVYIILAIIIPDR